MTPTELQELLSYDPETGDLTWKPRPPEAFKMRRDWARWKNNFAGTKAGRSRSGGYVELKVWGKPYKAHRIIWALTYGQWPDGDIDHINGDPSDNRLSNLREVSHAENMRNQAARSTNKSGYSGVSAHKATGKYVAQIYGNGKKLHLGLFSDPEEAHAAYVKAKEDLGFSERHGA